MNEEKTDWNECIDMKMVEQRLQEISDLREEWTEADLHAKDQMAMIADWFERESERIREAIVWRQNSAMAWFKRPENNLGKSSRSFVNGTLKKNPGKMRINILDEGSVPKDLCTHKPEEYTPNKNLIKAWMKQNGGEIPSGADMEHGEDEYYVDTGHDKKFRAYYPQSTQAADNERSNADSYYPHPNEANSTNANYEDSETGGKPLHEWNGG